MTRIKYCGITRKEDILAVNAILPDYIGFVFWERSKRYVTEREAKELKSILSPRIKAVGAFVDADKEYVAELLNGDIIDCAQLHGSEDETYIEELRALSAKPIIKAYKISSEKDIERARASSADYELLDAGMGEGRSFNWSLIEALDREYFLAGGLNPRNASDAIALLHPYALDVSSGIETDGRKDIEKMRSFAEACSIKRKEADHD